jgi:tetratricopeptide (TPR) repeat protein
MSDNYEEETKPLFRLLRTEAFRFILVRFNHYSLVERLKADIKSRFPQRPTGSADAATSSYRDLVDSYYATAHGIFFIDNFDKALGIPEIYTGLNLRRDKLARYPIAMICFIAPGAPELYIRSIMEKMPDLWSFNSLVLDLQSESIPTTNFSMGKNDGERNISISSLGGRNAAEKRKELERLQALVATTAPADSDLLNNLYDQIWHIQRDLGLYIEAIDSLQLMLQLASDDKDKASILIDIGDLYRTVGQTQEALTIYTKALNLIESRTDSRYDTSVLYERIGYTYSERGNLSIALGFYEKNVSLSGELYESKPENVSFKNGLAISYSKLGNIQSSLGNLTKALDFFEKYNSLEKELYEAYPDNVEFKNGLAISYSKLGDIQSSLGNLTKALEFFEKYNSLKKELYEAYPDNVEFKNGLAISYSKLGEIQGYLGDLTKALEFFEKFNSVEKELYEAYPDNVGFKNGLAISYSKLGDIQSSLGDLTKALDFFEKYNSLKKELYEAYPDNVEFKNGLAISYSKLGNIQSSLGDLTKALEFHEKDISLTKELYEAYPDNVQFKNGLAISYSKLGNVQSSLGDLTKALEFYEKYNSLERELYEAYPHNVGFKNGLAISYAQLGVFYQHSGNGKEAKEYFLIGEKLWMELVEKSHDHSEYQRNLNKVHKSLADLEK